MFELGDDMKKIILTAIFSVFVGAVSVSAQTSWLDRPIRNWNNSSAVPRAPRSADRAVTDVQCREIIRSPESLADRALTRAGWSLYGAAQTYGTITVINGLSGFDGMCRPTGYNTFVFSGSRFIGTLSPENMDSRTDGSLIQADLGTAKSISAEFNRYTSNDALCCPSQKSSVVYEITGMSVRATDVSTEKTCNIPSEPQQQNAVTGTVTYRNRSALPRNAVITVKLMDVSRADAIGSVVAEQRIEADGKQVPIAFSLGYKPDQIQRRNRYTVQAEIRARNGRLLYISDTAYPVLTQGNPSNVEIVVSQVRGGQNQGNNDRSIRGTVTYRERIALAPNSDLTVELIQVDENGAEEDVIAQMTFSTGTRQVPISFELPYAQSSIDNNANYAIRAEIKSGDEVQFNTAEPQKIELRRGTTNNVEIVLVKAETGITGKTASLSKFGTGTLAIEGHSSEFLIRGNVDVRTDGSGSVTVSGLGKSFTFSGIVTQFDNDMIRITVKNSGEADASGTIEVRYSGRSLRSITSTDLVLDSQKASIRF